MRFYGGVFLLTASVMLLQIIQTRILSVVMGYYLAFLVINLAMFGMTAETIWVYFRRHRFPEATLSHDLTYFASALAVASVAYCAIEMMLPPAATGKLTTYGYRREGNVAKAAFLRHDVAKPARFLPGLQRMAVIAAGAGRHLVNARVYALLIPAGIAVGLHFDTAPLWAAA